MGKKAESLGAGELFLTSIDNDENGLILSFVERLKVLQIYQLSLVDLVIVVT